MAGFMGQRFETIDGRKVSLQLVQQQLETSFFEYKARGAQNVS
jgi:hypothetical protein